MAREPTALGIHYFKEEIGNDGNATGRVEYNPVFSKTCQGGSQKLADTKWLSPNVENPSRCPVRLYKKLIQKRGLNITTDRMFLTPNNFWKKNGIWYKNTPIGKNEMSKWLKKSAERCGLDVKKRRITNHSSRSTVVSHLVKAGIQEQELIKITGHATASSLKPYLQISEAHHSSIIDKVRNKVSKPSCTETSAVTSSVIRHEAEQENPSDHAIYNNCIFNNCTFQK